MNNSERVKQIVVSASATRSSGALTIYKQFIAHLPKHTEGMHYTIFVNPSMPQPTIEDVEYIPVDTERQARRILFDWYGSKKELKRKKITPDLIISLQNTGLRCLKDYPQLIYFHQPFPFYEYKFDLRNKSELIAAMYKYFYPFFVKQSIGANTHFIGQIPFITEGIIREFHVGKEQVHTLFPDIEKIDVSSVDYFPDWQDGNCHFIYPATGYRYKGHATLINALKIVRDKCDKKIILHFTITKDTMPDLTQLIKRNGLEGMVDFMGVVPHENLLKMYKSAAGLLFPSVIETLGLPLIEGAVFGLPVVASNLRYAREVLRDYKGVSYVDAYDYEAWAAEIINISDNQQTYSGYVRNEKSSWDDFFMIAGQLAALSNNK